jgi:hypothetical protein
MDGAVCRKRIVSLIPACTRTYCTFLLIKQITKEQHLQITEIMFEGEGSRVSISAFNWFGAFSLALLTF